jgi:hypothetical protein
MLQVEFYFYLFYTYVDAARSDGLSLSQIVPVQIIARNEQEEENIKI